MDSDMDFPINTLERLKALDADVACTDMWSRNIPSFRTVMVYGPKDHGKKVLIPVAESVRGGQMDVDSCGMACTLIRVELLRKFAKKKIVPFSMGIHGEDATFCILAKHKFRAKIRCDFAIVAGHWGVCRVAGQEWSRDARNQPGALTDPERMKRYGALNVQSDVPQLT